MKEILSSQDLKFILDNRKTLSCHKMASVFGMTYNKFRYQCHKRGVVFPVYKNNGHSELFENMKLPEISYFLGFLWADGYVRNSGTAIEISVLSDDANEIKKCIDKLVNFRQYHQHRKNRRATTTITIGDVNLVNFLTRRFGVDRKSLFFMDTTNIPDKLVKYFLRGYLDGDGYISKTKIQFSASYEYDWSNFISVLSNVGIYEYKIRKYISLKNHRSSSMIINLKKNSKKMLDFIYDGYDDDRIGLLRKYEKYISYYKSL